MANLTEREIISQLKESLRLAAEAAYYLSRGQRGPHYLTLRRNLKLAEGCCRQMAGWREDTRWLPFGLKLAQAQQLCGRWLREKQPGWRFKGLFEILGAAVVNATKLETKKTGKRGIILPPKGFVLPVSEPPMPPGPQSTVH